MTSEALLKFSLNPAYVTDSDSWLWMMNQEYIQLIGEFPQRISFMPTTIFNLMNDVSNCTSAVILRLFADNTCLCFSSPKLKTLLEINNFHLKIVSEWMTANKFRIIAQKTSALSLVHRQNAMTKLLNKI